MMCLSFRSMPTFPGNFYLVLNFKTFEITLTGGETDCGVLNLTPGPGVTNHMFMNNLCFSKIRKRAKKHFNKLKVYETANKIELCYSDSFKAFDSLLTLIKLDFAK